MAMTVYEKLAARLLLHIAGQVTMLVYTRPMTPALQELNWQNLEALATAVKTETAK